jgi:nitroreductase
MSLYDVMVSRRSIRQFKPESVPRKILEKLINAARLAPSAANLQPLEYVIVDQTELCQKIFPCLKWAGYIVPEGNPKPGQEPTAYIVILANTDIKSKRYEWDSGAAIENIILAAWEKGVGSCWLISVDKDRVRKILGIPAECEIDSVLALGYPAEKPVIEDLVNSVKYWKDGEGQLHVPKRRLEDVIHFNRY